MNEVVWLVFVNEQPKGPKATMAQVFRVMDIARRGMGDNQIDTPTAPQTKAQTLDKVGHLFFGVLIDVAIVPAGAGKTDDLQLADVDKPPVNQRAANRRRRAIADIVVAENVEERHIVAVTQGA